MNRASYIKRLEAVEKSVSSGVHIVVWFGLPPIYVQISTGTGMDCKSEIKLFDSMEDVDRFLKTNYSGVDAVIVTSGADVLSADLHSFGL